MFCACGVCWELVRRTCSNGSAVEGASGPPPVRPRARTNQLTRHHRDTTTAATLSAVVCRVVSRRSTTTSQCACMLYVVCWQTFTYAMAKIVERRALRCDSQVKSTVEWQLWLLLLLLNDEGSTATKAVNQSSLPCPPRQLRIIGTYLPPSLPTYLPF